MTHQKHDTHSNSTGHDKSLEIGVKKHASPVITQGQREHMIAEAAYYIAEHRHFQGGDQTMDWLQAQIEIDNKMKSASH